jgi:hypothetical protein
LQSVFGDHRGRERVYLCPAHNDQNPNISVAQMNGRGPVHAPRRLLAAVLGGFFDWHGRGSGRAIALATLRRLK